MTQRLLIGISGASGIVYGIRLLEVLQHSDIETHLVVSKSAEMTLGMETEPRIPSLIGGLETFSLGGEVTKKEKALDADSLFNLPKTADDDEDEEA